MSGERRLVWCVSDGCGTIESKTTGERWGSLSTVPPVSQVPTISRSRFEGWVRFLRPYQTSSELLSFSTTSRPIQHELRFLILWTIPLDPTWSHPTHILTLARHPSSQFNISHLALGFINSTQRLELRFGRAESKLPLFQSLNHLRTTHLAPWCYTGSAHSFALTHDSARRES